MIDELKQWEYDRGYEKGKTDVLDKIRNEIEHKMWKEKYGIYGMSEIGHGLKQALDIIDKYTKEQE